MSHRRQYEEILKDQTEEINELHSIISDQEREIYNLQKELKRIQAGEKRVRIWKTRHTCRHCRRQTLNHTAFIGRRIYQRPKMTSLVSLLRKMGFHVKTKEFDEEVPYGRIGIEAECDYYSHVDLTELEIPSGIDEKTEREFMRDDNAEEEAH